MMSLNLSTEELKALKELYNLKDIQFTDTRYNDVSIRNSIISSISKSLLAELGGSSEADEVFTESIAIALTMGYFQSLNNDRVITETPDFGHTGLDEVFQTTIVAYMSEFPSSANASRYLESGLGVKIRECSAEDYFTNEYYHQDIQTLSNILAADIDDGYNKKLKDALNDLDDVSTSLEAYMVDLKSTYTILLADSFGISPYVGVVLSPEGFLTIADNDVAAKKITNGELTLRKLARRISDRISGSVKISDSRQFNYEEIFKSDIPVYFPRKILEYVLGRESTLCMNTNVYKPSAYSVSWESYSENYVFTNLKEILLRGMYKALEKVLLDRHKITSDFISLTVIDYKEFIMNHLSDSDIFDSVMNYMSKLVASLKCMYILTKYPYVARKITAIGLRVTCNSGSNCFTSGVDTSKALFNDLIATNNRETFLPAIDLTEGRTSAVKINISINIYEYKYEINPMLSHAEPLFGYTIQKQNQRKGKTSNWDNILIGEDVSGKELYASKTSDIKLQNNFIHNIYAGSRSGKGVMTMNILVSALVSGKPIFYLDRKPDMASMLYELSGNSQFIVNGGLINPEFDTYKHFDEETGDAMASWRNTVSYLQANPKILELFGVANTNYQSVLGDYIYFRAFMFCMGLCVLRTKLKGKNDTLRNQVFNGDNGIVIVVDELTGFQTSISNLFSTISSTLVQKALNIDDAEKILAKKAELESKIQVAQTKMNEATKESAKLQQEIEIKKLQSQINALVDEQSLYAGTLFQKIRGSFATLQSQKVAGFKNKEFSYSDIFVLGQFLDANYYASSLTATNKGSLSPVFFPLTADKKDYYAAYKGADIIRSFLEELGQADWFLGRNPDYDYGGKSENADAKRVVDEDGNWDYVGSHTCNEIRGVDSDKFSHVLFKPYLVLNTNKENNPPTESCSDPEYQYVTQCANRVNENAGGIDLWSTVRLKHIREDVKDSVTADNPCYDSLEEGIGFKGLVKETLKTVKDSSISEDINTYIQSILGKSGDIANYVAGEMGYDSWQSLIFDLSPEGLFSFDDMVNAVTNKSLYTLESRLPLYAKLGILGSSNSQTPEINGVDSSAPLESFEDRFGDIIEESNEEPVRQHPSSQDTTYTSPADVLSNMRQQEQTLQQRLPDNVLMSFCNQFATDKIELYRYKYPNKPLSDRYKPIVARTYFEEFRKIGY